MLVLFGCVDDAPRGNPLDPDSDNYISNGSLTGLIIIANQSFGIAGAVVWNETAAISVTTDTRGYFVFNDVPAGTHRFIAAKENYINDTFSVTIRNGSGIQVIRGLNGAPLVTFQQILTRKIDQYFPSPQYFVDITATVTDPNGIVELDSVWFGVDSLRYPLSYSVSTKNFQATVYKYDFPTNSIQWLVGKPLTIVSRDVNNAVNISTPFYVTRVIENEASPKYPSSLQNDTVKADSLYFTWSPPNVTYNYSYSISLSRVDAGTQKVVWTLTGLNSFNEEYAFYSYPDRPTLLSGSYVWTISVVDDFGNYGRSKESAFVIK
ncbi:MAG: carboxypeptidase-like regulatory domain-containing protein [Bacteroidetes bacterium]|nr:carboxypeptidase-like regulatory domain-containing protein [Bacteroidota bacterium]